MSEHEYGKRPGSLPESVHRPRPGLARWVRTFAAIACIIAGLIFVVRGAAVNDSVWMWLGATAIALGVVGVLLAQWMFRRNR